MPASPTSTKSGASSKLLFTGNHMPTLRVVNKAIVRRFNRIPFSVTIPTDQINKSKRMVGILSLGDVSNSAPGDLLSECVKSVSAHH